MLYADPVFNDAPVILCVPSFTIAPPPAPKMRMKRPAPLLQRPYDLFRAIILSEQLLNSTLYPGGEPDALGFFFLPLMVFTLG